MVNGGGGGNRTRYTKLSTIIWYY